LTASFDDLSGHIAPDVLAAMADPAGSGSCDDRIAAHLAACRHCMAVYAEFSRAHVGHALAAEAAPDDLVERGKAIASGPRGLEPGRAWQRVPAAGRADPLPAMRRARRGRLVPALVAGAACAALVVWQGGWLAPRPAVAPDLQHAISERLRDDSYAGLVYTRALVPRARETRGPSAAATGADLTPLTTAFTARPGSAEVAFWLVAAMLAEGRLRDVREYLDLSRARFATDPRFHNLAAILAYKRSELPMAEAELRRALAIERDAAYLVNLARVLEEQGRAAEAEPLWAEVLVRHADAPIAAVARARGSF
jgi:tetratricopeptide (TPR) repeat protein